MKYPFYFILFLALLSSCRPPGVERLKVLGEKIIVTTDVDGNISYDTASALIPDFSFVNQEGKTTSQNTVNGKIYVADFFFTHCPSICPKMKAEMLKVYEKYKTDTNIIILSHSIDPARDSVAVLKNYALKLNINSEKWHLLTGNKDSIFALAEHYLAFAKEDPNAPGGFIHDGNFILVDKQRRIRGYYDGTTDEGAEKLLNDIETLLYEK